MATMLARRIFPRLSKGTGSTAWIHETDGKPFQFQHVSKDGYIGLFPCKNMRQARTWFHVAEKTYRMRQGLPTL